MLPQTAVHWLSSAEVGAEFGVEQFNFYEISKVDIIKIYCHGTISFVIFLRFGPLKIKISDRVDGRSLN